MKNKEGIRYDKHYLCLYLTDLGEISAMWRMLLFLELE